MPIEYYSWAYKVLLSLFVSNKFQATNANINIYQHSKDLSIYLGEVSKLV